jgi:hypothetical protein
MSISVRFPIDGHSSSTLSHHRGKLALGITSPVSVDLKRGDVSVSAEWQNLCQVHTVRSRGFDAFGYTRVS